MLINTLIIITHYTYIEAAVDSNPPPSSQRYMQPTHTHNTACWVQHWNPTDGSVVPKWYCISYMKLVLILNHSF